MPEKQITGPSVSSIVVMEDTSIPSLPDDPALLKNLLEQREARVAELQRQCDRLQRERDDLEIAKLRMEMELLRYKKWYYGPRADDLKHYTDSAQLLLEFARDLEERPVKAEDLPEDTPAEEIKTVRRVRRGRRNLAAFDQLPVARKEYDLPEDQKPCPCCGKMRERIGEESSWQVEYIPGHFERIEHVRIKYSCKHCEQNAQNPQIELAPKPLQPIDKGLAGPGLLAYVITSKYTDYLPLYRLQNIFARNGLEIDRATQSVWCGDVAEIVQPLYERMIQRLLQSHVIGTDDTVMPMLSAAKSRESGLSTGKTKQARLPDAIIDEPSVDADEPDGSLAAR
jgi:transposase